MGWTSWTCTRAEMIAEITRTRESDTTVWTCLAKYLSGNDLWTVWEARGTVTGEPVTENGPARFIHLDMMRRYSKDEWGHKTLSGAASFVFSCPLRFLDMVPLANENEHSWRDGVREYWAARRLPPDLAPGDVFVLGEGFSPKRLTIDSVTGRRILAIGDDGVRYRVKPQHLRGVMRIAAQLVAQRNLASPAQPGQVR